jgi:uncharacterized RDD family membrane protein YckC
MLPEDRPPQSGQPSLPTQASPPAQPLPPGQPYAPGQPPAPRQAFPPGTDYAVPAQAYQYQPGPAPGFGYPPAGGYLPAPPPISPSGQRLAEFGDRLVARIIDQVIVGGISAVMIIPIYLIFVFETFSNFSSAAAPGNVPFETGAPATVINPIEFLLPLLAVMAVLMLLTFVLAYLYEVEMMFRTGQTVGKRIMKLQVVSVDPALPLTRGIAAKRFLVMQGCNLVPGLVYLDGLWQLWDKPYRQCLHDKFPSTLVIKLNP